MARRKRNSDILVRAERRIESLRSINEALDFGNGLTLAAYVSVIDELRLRLAAYNTALSTVDKLADDVDTIEQAAMEISEKMLMGVGSRYGRTSQEYEMAGGSRRKTSRRAKATSTPPATSTVFSANGSPNGTSATASSTAAN